jgi:hypothetical protein
MIGQLLLEPADLAALDDPATPTPADRMAVMAGADR